MKSLTKPLVVLFLLSAPAIADWQVSPDCKYIISKNDLLGTTDYLMVWKDKDVHLKGKNMWGDTGAYVWSVNGVNIRMMNTNHEWGVNLKAITDTGKSYLFNQLQSKTYLSFQHNELNRTFSAIGFTKAFNDLKRCKPAL